MHKLLFMPPNGDRPLGVTLPKRRNENDRTGLSSKPRVVRQQPEAETKQYRRIMWGMNCCAPLHHWLCCSWRIVQRGTVEQVGFSQFWRGRAQRWRRPSGNIEGGVARGRPISRDCVCGCGNRRLQRRYGC